MKGGNASGPYVGGLVGFNRGAITASYATGASYTIPTAHPVRRFGRREQRHNYGQLLEY